MNWKCRRAVPCCLHSVSPSLSLSPSPHPAQIYVIYMYNVIDVLVRSPIASAVARETGKRRILAPHGSRSKRDTVCAQTERFAMFLACAIARTLDCRNSLKFISTPSTKARMPDAQHLPIRRVSQQIIMKGTKVKICINRNMWFLTICVCLHFSSIRNWKKQSNGIGEIHTKSIRFEINISN